MASENIDGNLLSEMATAVYQVPQTANSGYPLLQRSKYDRQVLSHTGIVI